MISQTESLKESLVTTEHTTKVFITMSGAPLKFYLRTLRITLQSHSFALTPLPGWRRPLPLIRRGLMTHISVRSPVPHLVSTALHAQGTSTSTAPGPTPASTQTWSVTDTPSARTMRTRTMRCAGRNTLTRRW